MKTQSSIGNFAAAALMLFFTTSAYALYPGCTDPLACNFDPSATIEDGSCYYVAPNDVCSSAMLLSDGVSVIASNTCSQLNGSGAACWVDGVQADVWYSFVAPFQGDVVVETYEDGSSTMHDTQLAIYSSCGGPIVACDDDSGIAQHAKITISCGQLIGGSTYYVQLDGFNGETGNCVLQFHVNAISGCTDSGAVNYNACASIDNGTCTNAGCNDVNACNFNALATSNDGSCCYGNCISVQINGGLFPNEIGYTLTDTDNTVYIESQPGDIIPNNYSVCLSNGCYTLALSDLFGDGWNGGSYTISDQNGIIATGDFPNDPYYNAFSKIISFTLGGGIVGCTNASACNYDPTASCDDGSCDFTSCSGCTDSSACNFNPSATLEDGSCCFENCILFEMYDSMEDTWDDGYYVIGDSNGNDVASGTMDQATDMQSQIFCLADGCYTIYVFGGTYADEISWLLYGTDQGLISGDGFYDGFINFSIGTPDCAGCMNSASCNYNPFATMDDGYCIDGPCVNGDNPWTALPITLQSNGICTPLSGTLAGATRTSHAVAHSDVITGEDIWYKFTAQYKGIRVQTATSENDLVIEIVNSNYQLVDTKNLRAGLGEEALNFGNLIPGEIYYIGVRNYDSNAGIGTFTICAQYLKSTSCEYGAGPYSLCNIFKAAYRGAGVSYQFDFTPISNPSQTFTRTQASDILVLGNVAGLTYANSYNVSISAIYTLTNSLGNPEQLIVPPVSTCSMNTITQPTCTLRPSDQCANGPKFRGAFVSATPWICGATGWEWEFTTIDPNTGMPNGAPINYTVNTASTVLGLGWIPQLAYGATYSVRSRPMFGANPGVFGTAKTLCIISQSSFEVTNNETETQLESANAMLETPSSSIYPNPNDGKGATLNLNGYEGKTIDLFATDALGRKVWAQSNVAVSTSILQYELAHHFTSGLYIVSIVENDKHENIRMIVR